MPTVTRWIKVGVSFESALGADKTISGITLATTGVVTSTAHGLANGNYVRFTITNGMQQLADRVLRIAAVTANTFEIEGVNTVAYDAFVSGKCNLVTMGNSFQTLMDASPSGGEQQFIIYRLLHDDVENQIPSVKSPQSYSFRSLWDVADATLIAAEAASDAAAQKAFLFTFSNSTKYVSSGYVGMTFQPGGSAGEIVECSVNITGKGRGKGYAT